jgi:hypothetical protein
MCLRSRVAHPLPCTEESSASWRSCSSRKGGVGTRGPRRSRVVLSRSERPADPRYCFGLQASSNQRVYFRVTDSAGRTVVIGSACRCTSFQVPSSDRKMLVTRRATGVISLPPGLRFEPLDLQDVRELRGHVPRQILEGDRPAVAVVRCGPPAGIGNLTRTVRPCRERSPTPAARRAPSRQPQPRRSPSPIAYPLSSFRSVG